ncbi:hypothetical protein [Nocardia bovistercoris]|uniref:Uncharacterized protein n=1 Tax=Nocardia bovistercoris TaxID=2785916 RepID=A0A931IHB3_9NOCA|nr:hypothetical protein [Nocardia bovistercoris]MBH0780375.1 hypothetical protein [Nocardia bovistercoris]
MSEFAALVGEWKLLSGAAALLLVLWHHGPLSIADACVRFSAIWAIRTALRTDDERKREAALNILELTGSRQRGEEPSLPADEQRATEYESADYHLTTTQVGEDFSQPVNWRRICMDIDDDRVGEGLA